MDAPEDLKRAAAAGCAFALVEISSVEPSARGTRSQTTAYRVAVIRSIRGPLPDELVLVHYGTPRLAAGDRALVGARDSRRFHAGWQLEYLAALGERDSEEAADELEAQLATLASE